MSQEKKTLGVIGGLGPMATAYFMELVIRMTQADTDQDHLEMILYNAPSIPNRTAFILGESQQDPLPQMCAIGQALTSQGAGVIAIPCITAHSFYDRLQTSIGAQIIHALRETAAHLQQRGITTVGILATSGTIATGVLHSCLAETGIAAVVPNETDQAKIMDIIYRDIKAGKEPNLESFLEVSQALRNQGAQVLLLGCTELSLIKRSYTLGPGYLDMLEVLAQQAVLRCGAALRPEYENLIST